MTKPVNDDTLSISIQGDEPKQIMISFFKRDKVIYETLSDTNKIETVPRNKLSDCDSIFVGIVGYKPIGQKINNINEFDYDVELVPYTIDDFQYEFVTNYGHGFKMKISSTKLCLKYARTVNHKEKQKWNKFKRMK